MKRERDERAFWKVMKELTFEEKIDYIWAYYKWALVVIVLIPLVIMGLVSWYRDSRIETRFSGNITNVSITSSGYSYLTSEYASALQLNDESEKIELMLSTTLGENIADANDVGVDEGVRVAAMVAAGTLDYIIADEVGLRYYATQGAFEDVTTILSQDQLSDFEIYYHTDVESGESYPVAIDISAIPFVRKCLPKESPVYLGFPINSAHTEQMDDFFAYLLQWNTEKDSH